MTTIAEVERGGWPVVRDLALPPGVRLSDRPVGGIAVNPGHGVEVLRVFAVDSTVQLDGDAGALVMWVLFSRRRSVTKEALVAHWRDVHAPLARRHHVGMCRYVQHVVTGGPDDTVDAIAELHFRTDADFSERFYDSEAGIAAIAADVARFSGRHFDTYLTRREPA